MRYPSTSGHGDYDLHHPWPVDPQGPPRTWNGGPVGYEMNAVLFAWNMCLTQVPRWPHKYIYNIIYYVYILLHIEVHQWDHIYIIYIYVYQVYHKPKYLELQTNLANGHHPTVVDDFERLRESDMSENKQTSAVCGPTECSNEWINTLTCVSWKHIHIICVYIRKI